MLTHKFNQIAGPYLESLHLRLASRKAGLQLALLGIVSGCLAGLAMVAFRLVIDVPQGFLFGADNPDDYEALHPLFYVLLPTLGGLGVGLLFERLSVLSRPVGVVHVLERLAYGEGNLPIKNAVVQFFSAALCILSGHSVGREGPAVHVGAACGSWLGKTLYLPNNSNLILVGCGSAGAIAAALNTPLAGVVFALEVILVEYTLASFTPIILAAVSATTVSHALLGPPRIFAEVPALPMSALGELLYVVLMGIAIGLISAFFVRLLVFFSQRFMTTAIWLRMTLAGTLTGLLALLVPEIMSIGYDTVNDTLLSNLELSLLLTILAGKLLATALGLGLGLPGGVIGPCLMMGALAGGATGTLLALTLVDHASAPSLYAMLGMGAMMGATLNAPLTALITLVELTVNPHIILPGMLAIIAAELTSHYAFGTPSVFKALMQTRGLNLNYSSDPLSQFLRRLGVAHAMNRQVMRLPAQLPPRQLQNVLLAKPNWVVIHGAENWLLSGDELLTHLETLQLAPNETIDLTTLSVRRITAGVISSQATLEAALHKMNQETVEALCVRSPQDERILGVVTKTDIERSYRLPLN